MRLTASELITFHRPKPCGLRVFLKTAEEPQAEPSAFDKVLRRLGERHEQEHLQSLGPHLDLSQMALQERLQHTRQAVLSSATLIYQGALQANAVLTNTPVEIFGIPDFLIAEPGGYVIRDAKMFRSITEEAHPEILLQLQLYGWLFERTFGIPAKRLEVWSGRREIVQVPYDGGAAALDQMAIILRLKQLGSEPYEPVGQSKCTGCGFEDRCWKNAEVHEDVSLLVDVDQGLARQLHSEGINSVAELLKSHTANSLSELRRPRGNKMARVGTAASRILMYAETFNSKSEIVLAQPALPNPENFVMFDVEGMPPHLDELDKIYLWGAQVFGSQPGEYMPAVAGFGPDGDREGWEDFLAQCERIFEQHGDIPFVHWSAYERTYLNRYIQRHGDPKGIAARVVGNLLDLYPITKSSVILPVPSYGLKTIEQYVGFKRTQEEFGGSWSMAMFIEATETQDEARRNELMGEIIRYNEEDLQATWAVLQWLKKKKPSAKSTTVP